MKSGIINAFYVDSENKSVKKIKQEPLPSLKNENDYIWLQLNFASPDTRPFLQSTGINDLAISTLTKPESRPRVNIINDELMMIIRGVNLIKGEKPENMISVRIMATKNLLITCQKKSLNSVKDIVSEFEQGTPPLNTGDFIVRLNERIVMNMSDVMEDIEERAIEMEELIIDDENQDTPKQDLHNMRRQIIQLKRFLIPQRDALNKLQLDKTSWMTTRQQVRLREVADLLMRYLEMLDASRDLAAVNQETLAQRQNEQINRRMYLLSIIAALFLPLSFFTGLFGVNLAGIPKAEDTNAFLFFVAALLLIASFMFWFFRRNRWL